jgi:hypothetical protein
LTRGPITFGVVAVSVTLEKKMQHTFTEWSVEAVNTRQDGNGPKPQAMSVIGSVWSDKSAYASGISSRTLSSNNLPKKREV